MSFYLDSGVINSVYFRFQTEVSVTCLLRDADVALRIDSDTMDNRNDRALRRHDSFPLRIHSIAALGTRECELDGVVVSDPLAYRIERLGREIWLDEYRHTSSESATVDIDSEVVDDSVSWSRVTRSETAGPERPTSSPIALNERRAFSANSERISMSVSSKSRILAEKDARCDTILQKTLWNTSFHGRSNSSIEAANDKEEPSVSLTGMSHTISVEGMTCSHCEQIVEEAGYTAHA